MQHFAWTVSLPTCYVLQIAALFRRQDVLSALHFSPRSASFSIITSFNLRSIDLGLQLLHAIFFSNKHDYVSNFVILGPTGAEIAGGHYFPRLPSAPRRIIPKPSPENVIKLGTIGCPLFHATRPFFIANVMLDQWPNCWRCDGPLTPKRH